MLDRKGGSHKGHTDACQQLLLCLSCDCLSLHIALHMSGAWSGITVMLLEQSLCRCNRIRHCIVIFADDDMSVSGVFKCYLLSLE